MSTRDGERRESAFDAGLPQGISLDELNTNAELLTRTDRKYVVDVGLAECVIAPLLADHLILDIGGCRQFRYDSTYFDTPERISWRGAAHDRKRRFKVRIRHYVDSDLRMLEVKTEGGRSATVKDRVRLEGDGSATLDDASRAFVAEILSEANVVTSRAEAIRIAAELEPTVVTRYRRATLADPSSGSRLTVDTVLDGAAVGGEFFPITDDVVIETKTAGRPCAADRALWANGVRPLRVSKFALATALADPDRSANRWNVVLRRHCKYVRSTL